MESRVPLDREALEGKLRQQVGFLERSADLYDAGHWDEAARLATAIRVLVHTTRTSASVLTQLELLDQLGLEDRSLTREMLDEAAAVIALPGFPQASRRPEAGVAYAAESEWGMVWTPMLDGLDPRAPTSFDAWWSTKIIEDSQFRRFSRKHVVLTMANQDGGAHVDPGLDAEYAALRADNIGVLWTPESGDWTTSDPPGGWLSPRNSVVHASIRHIAYEVLATLRSGVPYLL